jgi:large subunit ribosomal protein LP0
VRRAIKGFLNDFPQYERLLPHVKGGVKIVLEKEGVGSNWSDSFCAAGNVGFVFTNGDLKTTRDKIVSNKVAAPARAGAVAPLDVSFPLGRRRNFSADIG